VDVANVAEQLPLGIDGDVYERLRRNIKLLIAAGITTAPELYKLLNLTRTTWSQRMTGPKPTPFSLEQTLAMARHLHFTVEELLLPSDQLLAEVAQLQNMEEHTSECPRCQGTGLVKVMGTLYACPVRPTVTANPRFIVIDKVRR